MPLFYADASALVKLVREEPESEALRTFVGNDRLASSELVLVEVPRAIRRAAGRDPALPTHLLLERAEELLDAVGLVPLDHGLLAAAGAIETAALRALDAIHLATAISLMPIDALITYDDRQGAVGRLAGLRTIAPGA